MERRKMKIKVEATRGVGTRVYMEEVFKHLYK
jgi:hypothetical protein